ncbi:MAG TPA: hypothetical protein VKZ44_09170, partial [Taishania sp.]|nr:hypothetical protein [Taishania sp.]
MIRNFTLQVFLLLIAINFSFSQRLNYDRVSPWFLGANVGATWQHTDVNNRTFYGWGLVFGRTFNYNYGNIFSYDLKLRYLGGAWRGLDSKPSGFDDYTNTTLSQNPTDYKTYLGYSINNFQTKSHELNLELSIHLNRLIERTGWDPYIFGGAGLSFFRARGDLFDEYDYLYNYNFLADYSKGEVKKFINNDFESDLDYSHNRINAKLMGHLGVGLGYYVSPNVALGIEHKTTFTGVDYFDGVVSNKGKYKTDIYHYTNLYLKIYLNRAKSRVYTDENVTHNPVITDPVNTPCVSPKISLVTNSNSTVNESLFQLAANLQNTNRDQISLTLNGIQTGNYTFNNNRQLRAQFQLQTGINTIVITATNECGSDQKTVYVNYVPECNKPVVAFTNPNTSHTNATNPSINVQAKIDNLDGGLVQFYINGQQSSNFNYNTVTGILTSTVKLNDGNNSIQIIANNNCGSHTQTIYLNYNRQCPTPYLYVNNSQNTFVTTNRFDITATVNNITNANQVEVYLNGQKQSVGTYSNNLFKKSLTLSKGKNSIYIRATNSCGTSDQNFDVEYGQPCNDPIITLHNPSGARTTSNSENYTLQATVSNVTSSNNISVKLNNVLISNYNYNFSTGLLTASIQLAQGSNIIEINASNECGYASNSATISFTKPCDKPTITWKSPSPNSTTTTASMNIEALINGINNASDVDLYVNGNLVTSASYNRSTKLYKKSINLTKGNNVIQLVASNNCGETNYTTNITLQDPLVVSGEKPNVTFTSKCGTTINAGLVKFTGNITGVTETSQIQFIAQGTVQTNVVYTRINNGFSFEYSVRMGYSSNYYVEITANNAYGSKTKSCHITTLDPPVVDNEIEICITENRIKKTIKIKESQWPNYEKMGATKGACPPVIEDKNIQICLSQRGKNVTLTIKESEWPNYEKQGAKKGACIESIDNEIEICVPNGNKKETKIIKESQWPTYQKMGATLGKCPEVVDNDIIVCVPQGRTKVTMTIKESQWPTYRNMGATLGECPIYDPEITICYREDGMLK